MGLCPSLSNEMKFGGTERHVVWFCRSKRVPRSWAASAAILAMAAVAWSSDGEPWNQKPYTEWTLADVLRVTQNSPWAHSLSNNGALAPQQSVQTPLFDNSPPGSWVPGPTGQLTYFPSPVPVQTSNAAVSPLITANTSLRDAVVLWSSSETIREAFVRMSVLAHKSGETQTKLLEPRHADLYRITVMASHIPSMLASYRGPLENALKNSVYLKSDNSRQMIRPVKMEAALKTSQPIINFYFPRELNGLPTMDPRAKNVKFDWASKNGEISVSFELRKMQHNGAPDL
jgi:hypothetical protein